MSIFLLSPIQGFPGSTGDKESYCQSKRHKKCKFSPWVGKIQYSRKWQPTPVLLPGKFHGQRSLTVYSPQGYKELGMTEWLSTHVPKFILYVLIQIQVFYNSTAVVLGLLEFVVFEIEKSVLNKQLQYPKFLVKEVLNVGSMRVVMEGK